MKTCFQLVKKISLLFFIASLSVSVTAGDVQFYLAVKGLNSHQTNSSTPVVFTNESPFQFLAEVLAADTDSVANVTIKLPNKQLVVVTNVSDENEAADFVWEQGFITKKLLDAKFAAGSYVFAIKTFNDGSNSATLKLPKDAYPSVPHIANWNDVQEIESELPFIIRWDALTNDSSNDLVLLDVEDTNGMTIFCSPGFFQPAALNGTNISIMIPAGALASDYAYTAQLLVIRTAVRNTNSIPATTGIGGYFEQTKFPVVTLPDPVSGGRVQLSSGNYSVSENDSNLMVTVTRVGDEEQAISVNLTTSNDTAIDGTNYLGINTTLTFDPRVNSTNINVPILNDFKYTGNRTFNLALSGLTGNAVFGSRSNALVTIVDSQKANAGTLQFSPTTYSIGEASATVKITVKRTAGTTGAVGVNFHTVDGSATAGLDYFATNGTLTFGKSTSLTIPVQIINNSINETNAFFFVALDSTTGGATLGTNLFAKVTITDNDSGGVVSLSNSGYATNDNSGFFFVTVKRTGTGTLSSNASVDFATVDGSALAGVDYAATNGTLTFGSNQLSQTIAIPILSDTNAEGYQKFSFQISNPQGGAAIDTNSTATFTIQYDKPCIVISNANYYASEAGTNVTINLVRFGSLSTAASVDFATVDGSAISSTDYHGTNGTANFTANISSVKITIPIVDNTIVQSNRSFNFIITNAQGSTPLGTTTNAVVTIVDNDYPGIIQFAAPTFSAEEGSNAVVRITRTGGLASGVSVQFTMTNGTATAGIDYSNQTQTITFGAGVTNVNILVPLFLDSHNTTSRSANLALSNPTSGAALGSTSNAVLTILNNPNPNGIPLNGPLFISGTIGTTAFVTPTNSCTASSDPASILKLNASWNTGTVSAPIRNQLVVNIFPRALGTVSFNNFSASDSASYETLPLANPNGARTWSVGGGNSLTSGASGSFTVDAIDYTQKLASGRFSLRLQETTGNVAGGSINVTGSFRVALVP